jgi:hypothetical protein
MGSTIYENYNNFNAHFIMALHQYSSVAAHVRLATLQNTRLSLRISPSSPKTKAGIFIIPAFIPPQAVKN